MTLLILDGEPYKDSLLHAFCPGPGWRWHVGHTEPRQKRGEPAAWAASQAVPNSTLAVFHLDLVKLLMLAFSRCPFTFLIDWSVASVMHRIAHVFNPFALFYLEKRKSLLNCFYCLLFSDSFQLYLIYPRPNKMQHLIPFLADFGLMLCCFYVMNKKE